MLKIILLAITLVLITIPSFGQIHIHGADHHKKFEVGTADNLVYSINEKELAPGFHIHGIQFLSENIGIGLGYEGTFFDIYHQTVSVFGQYSYKDFLTLAVGPGLILPNKEKSTATLVAHVELSAGFDFWKVHLGPMLGCSLGSDKHISFGLHIGYHFESK